MPDGIGFRALQHRLALRLSACRDDGDIEAIREAAAVADADRLHCALARADEEAGTETADFVPAWSVLAEFHELRKELVPAAAGSPDSDFFRAAHYHCRLYRHQPELVPQKYRQMLGDHPQTLDIMGADPGTCLERVLLMAEALVSEETRQRLDDGPLGQLLAQALALIPPEHPLWPDFLAACGYVEYSYFCRDDDGDRLTRAIGTTERALRAMPDGHPIRATVLNDLSIFLRRAAHRRSDEDLLDQAVVAAQEALALTPVATREYAMSQITCANVLLERFHMTTRSADPALLDEAESLARAAIGSGCLSRKDEAKALSNLGGVLEMQYKRTERVDLLEENVEVSRRAVEMSDERDEQYPTCQVNLGVALLALARVRGTTPSCCDRRRSSWPGRWEQWPVTRTGPMPSPPWEPSGSS